MAIATNRIGTFGFSALLGNPIVPRMLVAENDRPGSAGTEFMLVGKKGDRFVLISHVDTDTYEDARDLYPKYLALTASGALELVQGGVSSTDQNYKVKVVDVIQLDAKQLRGACGNRQSNQSLGFLVCRWELKSVPVEEDSSST